MARMNEERAIDLSSIVLPDHVLRVLDRPSLSLSVSLSRRRFSSHPGFSLSSRFTEIRRADNAKGSPPDERTRFALRSCARSRVSATPSCARPNGLSLRDWKSAPSLRLLVT